MQQLDRTLASDAERDSAAERLQVAFAEGRLTDSEFDQRMRSALTARTRAELAGLVADLPEQAPHARPDLVLAGGARGAGPGRLAVSFKSSIRRAGRWRVPPRYTAVIYKGSGLLDLRAAELTAPVTTIVAVAYKSRVDILVPPGVRVETGGLGVSTGDDGAAGLPLPPGAPVVHVRGFTYKGTVQAISHPPALTTQTVGARAEGGEAPVR
jgi:hypothetical protein